MFAKYLKRGRNLTNPFYLHQICHCGGEAGMPLIAPCFCAGSLKYVHQDCLQRWIKSSDIRRCELCKYTFTMESKVREKRMHSSISQLPKLG